MLCIRTLVPTLLPFIFLSDLLTSSIMGKRIPILRPVGRLCRIPEGAEYIFLTGLLGGYPTGARAISQAQNTGLLSREDAKRMLGFCNNCGPAFIFGMASILFPQWWAPWLLLGIHVVSAMIVGAVLPGRQGAISATVRTSVSPVAALNRALHSMAGICGWVIIFRTVLAFWGRWFAWRFTPAIQAAICGLIEMTNGCVTLHRVSDQSMRFILCAGSLSFGGICVAMQSWFTAGLVSKDLYFPGKLLQSLISICIASLVFGRLQGLIALLPAAVLVIYLTKSQKICRNLQAVDV